MFCLKNEELTLEIASHGAEMRSLKDNQTGQEYLWDADPAFWKRTSPVLFPLVGNYRDKESIYEGKTYSMSQHGFARDMDFTVTEEAESEIWFELHETPETKEKYPFDFCLSIGYISHGDMKPVFHNYCFRLQLLNRGNRPGESAACACSKRDNGFSRKVVFFQKAIHRHRHVIPPVRVSQENNIVIRHVFHLRGEFRSCSSTFFFAA